MNQPTLQKLKSLEEMRAIREECRKAGKRVVFANGCFDVLHGGHVSYLEDARAYGDLLICGVNSDSSERGLKGPSRPIYNEDERLEILNAIRSIDYLVLFDEPTCENLLRELRPDVHAKGTDYTAETVPEREVAHELGIEVYIAGPPKENASRGVIATVQERFATK
jgi:D-glycero-beta-D-manno-heptose 1-phosphate adenylyltransferase